MKNSTWIAIGILATLPVLALGNEKGNGGNSCSLAAAQLGGPEGELIEIIGKTCRAMNGKLGPCTTYPLSKTLYGWKWLEKHPVTNYPSFVLTGGEGLNPDALRFFMAMTKVTVVSNVIVDGATTEASNDPKNKQISLSRELWCPLSKEEKLAVLFHEYLGVMELEENNEYHISSRFIPAYRELTKTP